MENLLVQMPRFNRNIFEEGRAIRVTDTSKYPEIPMKNKHCLITKVTPLELEVIFIQGNKDRKGRDEDEDDAEYGTSYTKTTLNVDDVSSGIIEIELMGVLVVPSESSHTVSSAGLLGT